MAIPIGSRRRVVFVAGVVAVMGAFVAVATWSPAKPTPAPSPQPSVTGSVSPSPSPEPVATPLPGLADAPRLPACDISLQPQGPAPAEVAAAVPGLVAMEIVGSLGGPARTALVDGTRVFVGASSRVLGVDLSDPRLPREVASSPLLPGTVEGVALLGDTLVVAVGDGGLAMLDAAGLTLRASLSLPGYAEAVAVDGTTAFVADGPGGLRVVDLRDAAAPVELAVLFELRRIVDVAVQGGVAYLATADEGLLIVDVRDPRHPSELGRLFTGGYAFGVAVLGEHVLVADGWGGLRIVDVGDPRVPRLVTTVPTDAWVMGVAADGDRAYLAAGGAGLQVIDLADPGNPVVVGHLPVAGGHAIATGADGPLAALVDTSVGIRIIGVRDGPPAELSTYAPLASADGLTLAGTRAFVAAKGQGLRVVDVSDPARPTDLPGISTEDPVRSAAVVGSNLFVTTDAVAYRNLFAATVSPRGPPAPGPFFAGRSGPTYQVTVHGSMVLLAVELGLWIIDGSQPTPCELAYLDTASRGFLTTGVTAVGDLAYIAADDGIHVVDLSDPRAPVLTGRAEADDPRVAGKEWAQALVVGSTLFSIASYAAMLGVYDLDSSAAPRLVGLVQLPAPTATADQSGPFLAFAGGHLFVAGEAGGLVAIDVSDPERPHFAGQLRLPGNVVGVVADDDHVYVASDDGGFFVVEWSEDNASAVLPASGGEATLASLRQRTAQPPARTQASGTCLVTTTDDSGPGSLRRCVEQAAAGTLVTFDPAVFPPARPATVHVREELGVPGGVTVDGTGAGVILDGGGESETAFGVYEADSVISGLEVTNFTGFGINLGGSRQTVSRLVIHSNGEGGIWACCNAGLGGSVGDEATDMRIVGNLIGLDRSGTRLLGAQEFGIFLQGSGHVVGGPDPADRNVIAGSRYEITLDMANHVTIQGNYIGIDATGRKALHAPDQVRAIDGLSTAGNQVIGNVVNGIVQFADPGSVYNSLVGNRLGVDPTGKRVLGRGGIIIGEPFNRVGGAVPGEGNILNGGIHIGANDVIVLGNRLRFDERDNQIVPGAIMAEKPRTVIGGRSPAAGNIVGGIGIVVRGSSSLVIGNTVHAEGVRADPGDPLDVAIRIESGARIHVIANVVESEAGIGILLGDGAFASRVRGNVMRGNAIGLHAGGASEANIISGNAFANNLTQARDEGAANAWDDGRRGNYWSDFTGLDPDGDGVLDRSRKVRPEGLDRYPLTEPP
ncbi:MAG: Beta helix protein [Chloroflexi bacterium]|nr:Beta helix protein [Chloroflexota bacterium]